MLGDGIVSVHVDPSVGCGGGLVVGVVLDVPERDIVSCESVSGDRHSGSFLTVAGGQCDQVAVAAGVSRIGCGGSDQHLPEEGVVDGIRVLGCSVVGVDGVVL